MKHDNKLNPFWKHNDWLPVEYRNVEEKFILVINDMQHVIQLAKHNKIVFLTADKKMSKYYDEIVVKNHCFGKDDAIELIEEWKDLSSIKSILDKYNMFDLAIMNPPYEKNLHLKILEIVIPHAEKVVNISPDDFFTNPYNIFEKEKQKINGRNNIATKIVDVKTLSSDEFNQLFGTAWSRSVSIMQFDNKNENKIDLSKYESTNSLMLKILKKVSKLPSLRSKFANKTTSNFVLVRRTNHRYLKWCESTNENIRATQGINFNTNAEELNFRKSFETWFYNFLNKSDWHGATNSADVPYMQDYSQPWDNKRFCDYFNITGYIDDNTAVPDSEWETILNTLNRFCN